MRSKTIIWISLIADLLIAASKFVAAAFTGSSSMISEGVHSAIDAVSQVLLLWGIKASRRSPDEIRPFGYGRELYFWSFIVSLMIFVLGGCFSFYHGLILLRVPVTSSNTNWNYAVLGIALAFTSVSLFTSLKVFNRQRGDMRFWEAV